MQNFCAHERMYLLIAKFCLKILCTWLTKYFSFITEINFLWAGHQAHHSSEQYNLNTALRQSVLQKVASWVSTSTHVKDKKRVKQLKILPSLKKE